MNTNQNDNGVSSTSKGSFWGGGSVGDDEESERLKCTVHVLMIVFTLNAESKYRYIIIKVYIN